MKRRILGGHEAVKPTGSLQVPAQQDCRRTVIESKKSNPAVEAGQDFGH